jgi:hypothetical protein
MELIWSLHLKEFLVRLSRGLPPRKVLNDMTLTDVPSQARNLIPEKAEYKIVSSRIAMQIHKKNDKHHTESGCGARIDGWMETGTEHTTTIAVVISYNLPSRTRVFAERWPRRRTLKRICEE